MSSDTNTAQEFLRHTVAAVAYRGGKALRNAPPEFAACTAGPASRTAGEILAHICDLYDWSYSLCAGREVYEVTEPTTWEADIDRFFTTVERFDTFLASNEVPAETMKRLLQGPVADSLTHIGQIAMLRRLADSPVKGENYYGAHIEAGRVGPEQSPPVYEFD